MSGRLGLRKKKKGRKPVKIMTVSNKQLLENARDDERECQRRSPGQDSPIPDLCLLLLQLFELFIDGWPVIFVWILNTHISL